MKKLILFTFLAILLVGPVLAFNADVAYVVEDNTNSVLLSELNTAKLSYDIIYEPYITSTDFSQYKMILVGDDNFENPEDIPVNQYNSLLANSYHFYKKGIIFVNYQWGWSSVKGSTTSPSSIELNKIKPPFTDNVPETFWAYNSYNQNVKIYYLTAAKAKVTKFIAHAGGTSHTENDAVVAVASPGTIYLNGNVGQGRSIFFGAVYAEDWTTETTQLFRNSLDWVLNGEDGDGDGYFGDEDCNDSDPLINPDAIEIAYDGIDQDCDGSDLIDVDEDGYNYTVDCNDTDSTYNPGSTDLTKNCINDAPTIGTLPDLTVFESYVIQVSVSASDPEEDNLTYYINSTSFTQQDNIFTWQTGYYDAGNYTFEVTVSDGQLNVTETFNVKVKDKNQPPILNSTIPNLSWDEDTNYSLNLSGYFYDPDMSGDLTYGIFNTSTDQNITANIVNETANFSVQENWNGQDWIIFYAYDGEDYTESNNVTLTVLPVNDAPVLVSTVPNQTWNEDENLTIDLSNYFLDIDSVLTYILVGASQITMNIVDDIATFTPAENWFGKETVRINATDGEFSVLSNDFNLTVLPINDAPVLDLISNITVLAGNLVQVNPTATDVDGDLLSFEFGIPLDGNGQWQTTGDDAGDYVVTVTVSDGNEEDFQDVNIHVLNKFLINEFMPNPSSGNEWIELYNIYDQSVDLSQCEIIDGANNIFGLSGTLNQNEFYVLEINNKLNNPGDLLELYCAGELLDSVTYGIWDDGNLTDNAELPGVGQSASRDPDGTDTDNDFDDFRVFEYPTKGLPSDTDMVPPVVELTSPADATLFTDTRDIEVSFIATDDYSETLDCNIFANDEIKASVNAVNNTEKTVLLDNLVDDMYSWNVECYDQVNYAFAPLNWSFEISAPDNPILALIENKQVNENETLTFTISATDSDGGNLFFSAEDLPTGANFIDNSDGTATFTWTPDYDQSGDYNVKFTVKDSTDLEDSETIEIKVNHVKAPPQFSDINRCEIINSKLVIDIKEPDSGDDFEIDEEINIEVEISNDYSEDLDVDVEVYLYDMDEENTIEDKKDSMDVDEGKNEDFEFTITVPNDIEDHDYAIFVLAEGKNGETLCNEKYVEINLERKDHDVIVSDVIISPEISFPGGDIDVKVDVENIGNDEEDVTIQIKNTELGILVTSEEFEIEEYDEDDFESKSFNIQIPEDAEEKEYELTVTVYFDNGDEKHTLTKNFAVMVGINSGSGRSGSTLGLMPIYLNQGSGTTDTSDGNTIELKQDKDSRLGEILPVENRTNWWLNLVLILGILVLIILIILAVL